METLTTKRLLLEPWDERHREEWRSICSDAQVMRFIGEGAPWEATKADDVFDAALRQWRDHGFGWRSVLEPATGRWLGFVGLNYVGPGVTGVAPDEVEIGWWIVRSAWGQGYATEGAASARDEGFTRVRLNDIIARLQPENGASSRVAKRIGMTLGGAATGRHGEPLHVYELDRAHWERLASAVA